MPLAKKSSTKYALGNQIKRSEISKAVEKFNLSGKTAEVLPPEPIPERPSIAHRWDLAQELSANL